MRRLSLKSTLFGVDPYFAIKKPADACYERWETLKSVKRRYMALEQRELIVF